jgi:hypothetical protein
MYFCNFSKKEIFMSQSKMSANGAESEKALAKFEPAAVLRFWQLSATRMMRANELMMRGMMGIAKKQMELGQELLQHRLATLQSTQTGETLTATASFARVHTEHNRKEMERVVAGMREATDDLKTCFSTATKALLAT